GDKKRTSRSCMLMECFDPPNTPDQLVARLEVVGKHATTALYNAAEYRRIPMRFLWLPLAKLQEGLGGKARAITMAVLAGLAVLTAVLVLVPFPLKMESKGQMLPVERAYVYPPVDGKVEDFRVEPGTEVRRGDELVRMYDVQLAEKMIGLIGEINAAEGNIRS